jgi:hypothetical protein
MDGQTLIETTLARNKYVGVVLDELRGLEFMMNHLLSMVDDCCSIASQCVSR